MKKRVILFFLFVLVSTAIYNYGAIPASERAALIAFYNSTGGDIWATNTGWKTPPLASDGFAMPGAEGNWFGVKVSGNTVTSIGLINNEISGTLPAQLGNLSNLQELSLEENQLCGALPAQLGNLSNLRILNLKYNNFSGPLPSELGNLSNLKSLNLCCNRLSGPIPSQLGNLSNLDELWLGGNQLTGTIPSELGNLFNLTLLFLDGNQLNGTIPPGLGNLSKLTALDLSCNQLSGNIPAELANLDNLGYLELEFNQLSGAIPAGLGNISSLSWIFLDNNQLSGSIPSELCNLPELYGLKLNANQLSGKIPLNFTKLTHIMELDIGYNCLYTHSYTLRTWLNSKDPDWEAHQDQCSTPPVISLNRSYLYFGVSAAGPMTGAQDVIINNTNGGTLNWTATSDTSWIVISPGSGAGPGVITISINPFGLSQGTYTGIITVSDPAASNSPQTISVVLTIYDNGSTTIPFGDFATPVNGSTVSSSIPVTGWALDNIEVKKVEIFNGENYVGDAVFVEGARPDVEQSYPGYPLNYKAGWGYLLLTNFLPDNGNGTFILYVIATDAEGNRVSLGSRTITCDNAHAVKPFGAIDNPTQCGMASGNKFTNWGWTLTPPPNNIPEDGSTIVVWVDGVSIGNPTYGLYREDIAALFPGYANSNGAVGYFNLDTTNYENGIHTIHWTAADSAGNTDGIGSRYFSILNLHTGNSSATQATGDAANIPFTLKDLDYLPRDDTGPVKIAKGYENDGEECKYELIRAVNGLYRVTIKELERIEIQLGENLSEATGVADVVDVRGYMIIDGGLRPLPIGSTLEKKAGKFYWSPGPGFYGKYELVFLIKDSNGHWSKKIIEIKIGPSCSRETGPVIGGRPQRQPGAQRRHTRLMDLEYPGRGIYVEPSPLASRIG